MTTARSTWPEPPEEWQPFLPDWCKQGQGPGVPDALVDRVLGAASRHTLCPELGDMWSAFKATAPGDVKVVLLGQDPYHGLRQAHGLAFSVADPLLPWPPSLRNVFKERADDLDVALDRPANLDDWASQGVLLLNSVLTTEMGEAGAHQGLGWEEVVVQALSGLMSHQEALVWVLWGKPAQQTHQRALEHWGQSRNQDVLIASPHPSPLAAYRGFWGSKPFSRANEALRAQGKSVVQW